MSDKKLSEVEHIKIESRNLRGTIEEGLANRITGAIAESDTQLTKFHGSYMQDNRDLRPERRKQKLEPLYSFMIRVRLPAGICTTKQWLAMDDLARTYANGTLKLTTRQTFQFHGILKRNMKSSMQAMDAALLDSIAACGDVNRNVMCNPFPHHSPVHQEVYQCAVDLSEHLLPKTKAYHEIWLNHEKVIGPEDEPLYGDTYLPRKFKIAIAIPPSNDVDILTNDLGFIAIHENDTLLGYNVTVGGGMGMTHGLKETYPRLADVIGYIPKEKVNQVAAHILQIQRDHGDRSNRKHARFKYTIDTHGIDWFKTELNKRLGWDLQPTRDYQFTTLGDEFGWIKGCDGKWAYMMFIPGGRVQDTTDWEMMTGLRELATSFDGEFRLSANQNLMISNISDAQKPAIEKILTKYKLYESIQQTPLRLNSMSCVAFPTCGLAMAEAERYLPDLITKIDALLKNHNLQDQPISIRMTGCPNGCGRPYNAEIAFVGKSLGRYNLYLGASHVGTRLNKLYKEQVTEEEILSLLDTLFQEYAKKRTNGEYFGDYVIRAKHVTATTEGKNFHT